MDAPRKGQLFVTSSALVPDLFFLGKHLVILFKLYYLTTSFFNQLYINIYKFHRYIYIILQHFYKDPLMFKSEVFFELHIMVATDVSPGAAASPRPFLQGDAPELCLLLSNHQELLVALYHKAIGELMESCNYQLAVIFSLEHSSFLWLICS